MFKKIEEYPNYRINENGVVITRNNHILRPNNNNANRRPKLHLYKFDKNGVRISPGYNATVHRLVAKTFIPNPNNLPLVMHIDNDPLHNHVSNLKWGTAEENMQQCVDEGRRNRSYERSIYKLIKDNDEIICKGYEDLCNKTEYRHPDLEYNKILTKGPYEGYKIIKTDQKIIQPFKFLN